MSDQPSAGRASVLTPPGRGAIAVVAATGAEALRAVDAHFQAANNRPLPEQPRNRTVFGHWGEGDHAEEVIVLRGEGESLEIHCHGGAAATARIASALVAQGCRLMPWTEWIEQQAADPITAEADVALANSTTRRTAAILLQQRNGALAHALDAIRTALAQGEIASARHALVTLIERSEVGLHLTEPWQVAIAGRPNVGKSSLINALVGYQRAIVFDQPGTTRDVLSAETAIDGWPVRLTDAAGIRDTAEPLEAEGVLRARRQLGQADVVLWVIDAAVIHAGRDPLTAAQEERAEEMRGSAVSVVPLFVMNKVDLLSEAPESSSTLVCTSALTGAGIERLLAAIAQRLVANPPAPGEAVPFTIRQVQLLEAALRALDDREVAATHAKLAELTSRSA
jgi:tRNA modification GTPase